MNFINLVMPTSKKNNKKLNENLKMVDHLFRIGQPLFTFKGVVRHPKVLLG